MIEACVSVVDLQTGVLVRRFSSPDPEDELRHLALGQDTIFAIRARLGPEGADFDLQRAIEATEDDLTSDPGASYLPSAPLFFGPGDQTKQLADRVPEAHLRQGLSVEYDAQNDEFIASYPSSHRLMVFSGRSGRLRHSLDTRTLGLEYPRGIAMLPDGTHYAVAGFWENLHIFERGTHRHQKALGHKAMLYGHSHMTAA